MLQRLAPAAFGKCGAWRLRHLGPGTLGADGAPPTALGACGAWPTGGAWRLRRLAAVVLGAIACLGWHRGLQRSPEAKMSPNQSFRDVPSAILS